MENQPDCIGQAMAPGPFFSAKSLRSGGTEYCFVREFWHHTFI